MTRNASCHCGALVLRCAGEPAKVSLCHCDDCQRRTGSLFSVCAFFPRTAITVEGRDAKVFRRASASGSDVAFHFCPDCGTTLWWEPDRMPHLIGVAVGGFADPDFPMPAQAVWDEHRHRWLELPEAISVHERNPVRKPPSG
ncbi:GFA family protein [uncultured Parasphingopyxis sp.]|uniref:GFA family protein n=1 Tax=uncultured Parasphingopyxis sp. TaxID=1547918 RepID=UPI00260B2B4B|nr:GFA family protein [uncultured Parasphingopyxis sp.]